MAACVEETSRKPISINTNLLCVFFCYNFFVLEQSYNQGILSFYYPYCFIVKQSSGAGPGPPDESIAQQKEATAENNATSNHSSQQKIEATAENNATSNHSSGYMECVQRNRECIEKGTDAQVFKSLHFFLFSRS